MAWTFPEIEDNISGQRIEGFTYFEVDFGTYVSRWYDDFRLYGLKVADSQKLL